MNPCVYDNKPFTGWMGIQSLSDYDRSKETLRWVSDSGAAHLFAARDTIALQPMEFQFQPNYDGLDSEIPSRFRYLAHAPQVRWKLKLDRLKPDGIWVTRLLLG